MIIKYKHVRNSIKLEIIKLSINIWIVARQIETLKRHNKGFNRDLIKLLVTHNLDENHPHKKITKKREKLKETTFDLEVAFDSSQDLCVFLQCLEAYL